MPTLTIVSVSSIVLSPNPVNINSSLAVTVTAAETTITLQAEPTYSGDCYSGDAYAEGG